MNTKPNERFRLTYQFLIARETSGATFTADELATAVGWKLSSARTNLTKKLKEIVPKTEKGYRVVGVSSYSEDEFCRLMSQSQVVSADPKKPQLSPNVEALVIKARSSALLALQIYNNPTTTFKTEGFAVLMVIAWTSLLHALFEKRGIDYFYKSADGTNKVVDGDLKAWELSECLSQFYGGTTCGTRTNLEFFIKFRNRVEHRFAPQVDPYVAGECQAMLFNFDELLIAEFGSYFAIRESLAMPLQTSNVRDAGQAKAMRALQARHYDEIKEFVDAFRSHEATAVAADPHFSFRVYLVPKVGNHSSADMALEFVKYDPANADAHKDLEHQIAMVKEQRVPVATASFLPSQVVAAVQERLGKPFSMDMHTRAWKFFKARPQGKFSLKGCDERYCAPDPAHKDYLFTQAWIDLLVNQLADDEKYRQVKAFAPSKPRTRRA